MSQPPHVQLSILAIVSCLLGCARTPDSSSSAAPEPTQDQDQGQGESLVVVSLCEHLWELQDSVEPAKRASITADSPAAATACVPELKAQRQTIGDAAFEREASCVLEATNTEALRGCSIGPDHEARELCEQVLKIMDQVLGDDAARPSEAELTQILDVCMHEASAERLTADPARWRAQADCVRAADSLELLERCEDAGPQ